MSGITFASIAKQISETKPKLTYGSYKEHPVLRALCKAYSRINSERDILQRIETEEDAKGACDILYDWYRGRYLSPKPAGETEKADAKGNNGVTKNVNFKNTYDSKASYTVRYVKNKDGKKIRIKETQYQKYHFDEPYDARPFRKYLTQLDIPARDEDYLGFVLHVAVAFLLKPVELDDTLKACGFQKLHVRNIHHLAIYATLADYWEKEELQSTSFNPFVRVKLLYEKAREILNDNEPAAAPLDAQQDHTRWIREHLLTNRNLTIENFEDIVKQHKDSFTMLHKQILEDHHKFAALFSVIFDPGNTDDELWDERVREYSLFHFTDSFCCPHCSRDDFEKKLYNHIDLGKKHPTRELMIIFWVYAMCFTTIAGVAIEDDKLINKIKRKLKKCDDQSSKDISDCYDDFSGYLDLSSFLSGRKSIVPNDNFDGTAIVEYINVILTSRYEWASLNPQRPFDYCIINILKGLRITDFDPSPESKTIGRIIYRGMVVNNICKRVDSVPYPLCVISMILKELSKYENYPLACSLYVQL